MVTLDKPAPTPKPVKPEKDEMKKFNPFVFFISAVVVGILTFVSFLAAFGEDEGDRLNLFWLPFAKLYYILRFPTHTLFFNFFVTEGGLRFYFGLFINTIIYAFLIERLFTLYKKKPKISL